jgi:hypothetical protein
MRKKCLATAKSASEVLYPTRLKSGPQLLGLAELLSANPVFCRLDYLGLVVPLVIKLGVKLQ